VIYSETKFEKSSNETSVPGTISFEALMRGVNVLIKFSLSYLQANCDLL
jgi:hypothetical protein